MTKYHNDQWTLEDDYGIAGAGDALARMILEVEPPFSIRITGKWGSGKTSVLRRAFATLGGNPIQQAVPMGDTRAEMDEQLWGKWKHDAPHRNPSLAWAEEISSIANSSLVVWYSPWQHQNTANPLIPLLLEIRSQFKTVYKIKDTAKGLARQGGLAALTLLERLVDSATSLFSIGSGTSLAGTTEAVQKAWKEAVPNLAELTDGQRFHLLFEDAVKIALKSISPEEKEETGKERLIIFIDDLDRCEEETIVNLLECIKLYLGSNHCVFVLGMDDPAVMGAVCRRWDGRTEDDNREYLEKMFQATMSVPLPGKRNLRAAIAAQLGGHGFDEPESSAEIIEALLEPNPRKVKNFCNSLCASWVLLQPHFRGKKKENNFPTKFILLHYLRTFHNPVWRLLERQPYALVVLYKVLGKGGDIAIPRYPGSEGKNSLFDIEAQVILEKFFRRAFSHVLAHDGTTGKETKEKLHLDLSLDEAVSLFTSRLDRKRSDEFFKGKFLETFLSSEYLDEVFLYLPSGT